MSRPSATRTTRQLLVHSPILVPTDVNESMFSVPLYDEIVSGLAISRRLSVNSHTKAIRPAATTQVYPAATLLQASDARSEVITFGTQRR